MITIITHDLEKIAEESKGRRNYTIAQLAPHIALNPLEYVHLMSDAKPADENTEEAYQLRSVIIFTGPKKGIFAPQLSEEYSSIVCTPSGTLSPSLFVKSKPKEGFELKFRTDKNGDAYTTFSEEFRFGNFTEYLASLAYITEAMINGLYSRSGLRKNIVHDNIEMMIRPGSASETATGLALVEDDETDTTIENPGAALKSLNNSSYSPNTASTNNGKPFHSRRKTRRSGEKRENPLRLIISDREDNK